MIIDEKKIEKAGKELLVKATYVQPLLTKHDVLHALTGASGVVGCAFNQCT